MDFTNIDELLLNPLLQMANPPVTQTHSHSQGALNCQQHQHDITTHQNLSMFQRVDSEVEDCEVLEQAEQIITQYEKEQHQNHKAVTKAYFLQNIITLTKKPIQVNKINNESDIATKA